jgi:hypothetical protein
MGRSLIIGIFMVVAATTAASAQEKVVVGGSAVLTEEFAVLAKSYMAKTLPIVSTSSEKR